MVNKRQKKTVIKKIQARHKKRSEKSSVSKLLSFVIVLIVVLLVAMIAVVYLNSTGIYESGILEENNNTLINQESSDGELESYDVVISEPKGSSTLGAKESLVDSADANTSIDVEPSGQVVDKGTISLEEIEAKEAEVERIIRAQQLEEKNRAEQKKKITTASKNDKPKLIIIVDDISNKTQLKAIKALPFKVTPSIFPPTKMAPHSPKLAENLQHYMIHLPLQSNNESFNAMMGTLMIDDSDEKISLRIDKIKSMFPGAKYINNHTGSVFTSNYNAIERLYSRLREAGLVFIDSRTSSNTKVEKITYDYGDRYIYRDVFLDNKLDRSHILQQLKLAVKKAKKKGHAIAMCHPHAVTMETLKSAESLLGDVELLYVDEYYGQ